MRHQEETLCPNSSCTAEMMLKATTCWQIQAQYEPKSLWWNLQALSEETTVQQICSMHCHNTDDHLMLSCTQMARKTRMQNISCNCTLSSA